jgi:hypothetical protein
MSQDSGTSGGFRSAAGYHQGLGWTTGVSVTYQSGSHFSIWAELRARVDGLVPNFLILLQSGVWRGFRPSLVSCSRAVRIL